MNLIKVKCWYLRNSYFDITQLDKDSPNLLLVKKSILKNGYRAFFLNDKNEIENSDWYQQFLLGSVPYFYIEGSGLYILSNIDIAESELYFERNNKSISYKPWIFFSWQSDFSSSRNDIKDAIKYCAEEINKLNPINKIEIVESTRPEDGAKDILKAILDNINKSLLSIFDISNVSQVLQNNDKSQKSYPNANVVFELSYALSKKPVDQIIIIKKKRNDIDDNVPFDFRQNRFLIYEEKNVLKKELLSIIKNYFERIKYI